MNTKNSHKKKKKRTIELDLKIDWGICTYKGKKHFFIKCPICGSKTMLPLADVINGLNAAVKVRKVPRYISRVPKFDKDAGEWEL